MKFSDEIVAAVVRHNRQGRDATQIAKLLRDEFSQRISARDVRKIMGRWSVTRTDEVKKARQSNGV